MKYFVYEVSVADGVMATQVTPKDDYNVARMLWHQIRASQLANNNVTYGLAMIIDETGRKYESEYHGSADIVNAPEPV